MKTFHLISRTITSLRLHRPFSQYFFSSRYFSVHIDVTKFNLYIYLDKNPQRTKRYGINGLPHFFYLIYIAFKDIIISDFLTY